MKLGGSSVIKEKLKGTNDLNGDNGNTNEERKNGTNITR